MFVDGAHCLAGNPAQLHYGVCVTDLDGDGAFEIVVTGFGCPTQVLKWDGAALFDIADAAMADPESRSIGIAAADIDGDGLEEIYILNTDTFAGPKRQSDRLYSRVDGIVTDLFRLDENRAVRNVTAGRSVAALDRLGSGRFGFVVANYGGPFRLYEITDTMRLVDRAGEARVNVIAGGRGLVTAPFFGRDTDIFAATENGANLLFRNDGTGRFDEVAAEMGLTDRLSHGRGVAVFDPPEGGPPGLAYVNWEGASRIFHRRPDGRFIDRAPPSFAAPGRSRTVIAADFDNDGYQEIFINNIGQANKIFAWREGGWRAVDIGAAAEPRGLGTGAAVVDIDGDGRLELLIAHGEAGAQPLTLYSARDCGHHWIRIAPLTAAGAPARGAIVSCDAGDRRQRRVIDGGSGYLCQMEPVAHFGLGAVDAVQGVEVVWPDGARAVLEAPQPDQLHRVAYPTTGAKLGSGPAVFGRRLLD